MRHVSDPEFLVLHSLRLKGFAAEPELAGVTGLTRSDVDAHLAALHGDGFARFREGRITGWALTDAGREQHAEHVAADLRRADCRPVIEGAYAQFLDVNQVFLAVCTDWQVRVDAGGQQLLNDHLDASYDSEVIRRLHVVDSSVQSACSELTAAMTRFAIYGPGFTAALSRVDKGEQEWFTGALIASYHTVWFQLHEDLLTTLGIQREKEGAH